MDLFFRYQLKTAYLSGFKLSPFWRNCPQITLVF